MLLLFPLILTFSFALSPAPTVDLNILKIIIPVLFVGWLINSMINKKIVIDYRPRFWLLLIFLFITFFSIFWTSAPVPALRKILFFVSTMPIYFVFYQAQQNKNFLFRFLNILIVSTFIASLLALIPFVLQFVIGLNPVLNFLRQYIAPFFLGNSLATLVNQYSSWLVNISGHTILRTFGTFPDPHLFSLYLAMILPLTLYFYQKTKQKKNLFYFSIILLTILFSFSRGAYLSLIVGELFLLFVNRPFNLLRKHLLFFYSLFVIVLFLIIIPNPLTNRLSSSFSIQEGSNSDRLEMWLTALDTIKEHPLIGVGLAGFGSQINNSLGIRNPIYAHNLFLDFGAETGIFNMFILLLLITSPIIFYLTNQFFTPVFINQTRIYKSTPSPSFIPLRHPTSPSHFAKTTRDERLRRTGGYEGQVSGEESRKSISNHSLKKGGGAGAILKNQISNINTAHTKPIPEPQTPIDQTFPKYLALSFLIFFVHSLFETPFFSIHVFPLFLILLAINPSSHPQK